MSDDPTTVQWLAQAGRRVGLGLVYLIRRTVTWPWSTPEGGQRLGRLAGAVAVGWVALRVTGAIPWTRWAAIVALLAWAYSLDARDRSEEQEPQTGDETPEAEEVANPLGDPQADPLLVRAELIRLLHNAIRQRNGVHLSTLASALSEQGFTHWNVSDLKRHYVAAGVPVRDQLFLDGKNRVGISRDDLIYVPVSETPPPNGSDPTA